MGSPVFEDVERQYRPKDGWGVLSAWAWGASRVMDWIETEPILDAAHVAVVGHSRGGKTALVAGVYDRRFAMACSNNSGCSGAKLNHIDLPESEHLRDIVRTFQFWFCLNYTTHVNAEKSWRVDQHEFVALDPFENNDVGVDRHTYRQKYTRDTGKRKLNARNDRKEYDV